MLDVDAEGDYMAMIHEGATATRHAQEKAEEDALVEAMARAMFVAVNPPVGPHYPSPDDPALMDAPGSARGVRTGKAWEQFTLAARAQLAAHRAMVNVCSGKTVQL